MAEESSFFDSLIGSNGKLDREYNAEQYATYFKQFLTSGIYHKNNKPSLLVLEQPNELKTKVEAGAAYVEGYMYRNTDNIILTHAAAHSTNPRIDRIVVRLDRAESSRYIKVMVKQGTPATTPVPPALTRNNIVYELSLAQVLINAASTKVNKITDERLDESVCGLVSSLITIPTDMFKKEFDTFMAQVRDWFAAAQQNAYVTGGMNISIASTTPSNPKKNDLWIDTGK
ncbi:hypothetical protein FOT98_08785 [Bacillus sp. HY001]|uniref:hypothetical protein n=1 Tax=Bacillus TaxID=1386 RepID=UPI0011860F71|nr:MULTISPECIES: hypothetical protein [Bacillus]TSI19880.1 hypothetical protein FOT98_08785 [Bacillus sp. HY001]